MPRRCEGQVRDFPKEPTTDEARWLLGSLTLASGEPEKAQSLWMEISPGSSRWLDARLAVADLERTAVESQLKIGDHSALMAGYRRALRITLPSSLEQARTEADQAALWLAQARLNVVPTVGRPQLALALLDRLGRLPLSPVDRYRTRLLRMITLVEVGPPYLESEREAQSHPAWAEPSARWAFFDAARLIDECASHSEVVLAPASLRPDPAISAPTRGPGCRRRQVDHRGAGRDQAPAHASLPVPGR